MTEVYYISKLVAVDWRLTTLDGAPVTDATVTGTITLPDGSTAAATIDHPAGTNIYRALYDPTMAGTHAYRLVATGTADSADEGTFEVRASATASAAPTLDPTTTIGIVRLLIPDVDVENLLFSDAQIAALLSLEGGVPKRAVAAALDVMASNEAMVSKVIKTQDLSTNGVAVAAELRARATELRRQINEDDPDTAGGLDIIDFRPPFNRRYPAELTEEVWFC